MEWGVRNCFIIISNFLRGCYTRGILFKIVIRKSLSFRKNRISQSDESAVCLIGDASQTSE